MAFATVAKDYYAVGAIEGLGVCRPALVKGGLETELAVLEGLGEKFISALVGMGLGVFPSVGEEDDFLVRGKA